MPREVDRLEPGGYVEFALPADQLPPGAQQVDAPLGLQAVSLVRVAVKSVGAAPDDPPEFAAAAASSRTSLGARMVHLSQTVADLPVLFSGQVVRFGVGGEVQHVQGRVSVRDPGELVVTRPAEEAAELAVRYLDHTADDDVPAERVDLSTFRAETIADFPALTARPTVLDAGPLAQPVTASLGWAPVTGALTLCWDLTVAVSEREGAFRVLVAAGPLAPGQDPILFATQTGTGACTALVYDVDPGADRAERTMPRPWSEHGTAVGALPPEPPPWVAADATEGAAVLCVADGSDGPLRGVTDGGVTRFAPEDATGADQQVLSAFFSASSLHDWFYVRGFREADGSYQAGGVTTTGTTCKQMLVRPSSNPSSQVAAWYGVFRPPRMVLEQHHTTRRPSALDGTIVAHEYMHAVAARLVADGSKANPFVGKQCAGMYEGLSDFIAVTVTGETTFGSWVADSPAGLRRFPYDEDFPRTMVHFGRLPEMSTYQIGELWCAVLLACSRSVGSDLMVQILLDSLRGLSESPSLLSARDALLLALGDHLDAGLMTSDDHASLRRGLLAAFHSYGMGPDATADGVTLALVTADGPPDLVPL